MHVADQPAVIDVAHDAFDGVEGEVRVGDIMHRQHDAGDDLDARQKVRMPPKVYQMFRFRGVGKVLHRVVQQPRQRQTRVEPARRSRTWDRRSKGLTLSVLLSRP